MVDKKKFKMGSKFFPGVQRWETTGSHHCFLFLRWLQVLGCEKQVDARRERYGSEIWENGTDFCGQNWLTGTQQSSALAG